MSGWSVGWLVGFVSWLITYLLAYLLALLRLKSKPRHGEQETDLIPLCTDAPLFALTFIGRFCLHFFVVIMRFAFSIIIDCLVLGAVGALF